MPRFTAPVVSSADILPGAVTSAALADGAVTTPKLAGSAVTTAKLAALAVEAANLANSSVTSTKIANLAVGTAAIANLAVTDAKINTLSATKITAGTINTGTITIDSLLKMAAGADIQFVRNSAATISTNDAPVNGDVWIEYRGNDAGAVIGLRKVSGSDIVVAQLQVVSDGWEVATGIFHSDEIRWGALGGRLEYEGPHSAAARIMRFGQSYDLYSDNTGAGGNNTRLWIDTPNLGEFVLGPRSGSSYLGNMRLRSNAIRFEATANGVFTLLNPVTTTNNTLPSWRVTGSNPYQFLPLVSSERFKKYKGPAALEELAAVVDALPISRWKENAAMGPQRSREWIHGVTAEDAARVVPGLVTYDPEGRPFAFDPLSAMVHAIAALQDTRRRLEVLEAR